MGHRMRNLGLAAFAAIMAFAAPAVAADKLECGGEYVTKKGDTIQLIASKAYGPGLHRQLMVNILLHLHGQNAGALKEGTAVSIPCATEAGFEMPTEYWSGVATKPITVVMQTVGYDQNSPRDTSGLSPVFSSLIDEAMLKGRLEAEFRTLDEANLAADQPFPSSEGSGGISFPWPRTYCVDSVHQSRGSGQLCKDTHWSDPIFEVTSSIYVPTPAVRGDVANRRLCLANESRAAVLASDTPAPSRQVIAGSADECISMLKTDRVGAVIVPDVAAARENRQTPGVTVLHKALGPTYTDTIHAVVDKEHPASLRILQRLNDGIAKIRVNGQWYQIIQAHLTQQLTN